MMMTVEIKEGCAVAFEDLPIGECFLLAEDRPGDGPLFLKIGPDTSLWLPTEVIDEECRSSEFGEREQVIPVDIEIKWSYQ